MQYFLWQMTAVFGTFFFHPAEYKTKPHSDEVQMSAVKQSQLRILCAAVGADQQPTSLSASQTLSDQAVQSA